MKNYIKLINAIFFSLFTVMVLGQVKQITPPNIKSPFQSQSKKVIGNNAVIVPSSQSAKTTKPSTEKLKTINGSFLLDLKNPNNSQTSRTKESRTSRVVSNEFSTWFGLNQDHTFQLISEKEDELKITHSYYQQYYKGFLVEGSILMLHSKEGLVDAANGQVAEFASMETQIVISKDEAKNIAKSFLKVTYVVNEYPVETLICRVPSENGFKFGFAHKVRIDSSNPFVMSNVYVDAKTGNVINNISLIADIDTPSTANTLYSGTQSITTDSYTGGYKLIDNARKIETYDATSASETQDPILFSNPTTNWGSSPNLQSFTISTISQNWWYSALSDTSPDLYIIVKNAANNIVYNGRNLYKKDIVPTLASPIIFSLNIPMLNQPYSIEVWDFDAVGGDDFGGSYTVSSTSGIWSGNGNIGTYNITSASNNPALDIHWGMEKTYDFYKNIFGRNSFDGTGATIKNYYNPPQLQGAGKQNGAFSVPNKIVSESYMLYGTGDFGIVEKPYMKPVVGLDVEGHEFTHLVVANRNIAFGGLEYQGESGALNESFADIFGTCVEFYAKPSTANWNIGEDVMASDPFLRSMSNPNGINKNMQPDTYKGDLWLNSNCGTPTDLNDNCGVHRNSGVQNYWFYLLSKGGSGTNDLGKSFSVTGIEINKARQIAYLNLTTYLGGKYSTFMDSYYGSLLAADELYPPIGGVHSQEYNSVKQAWYAVGIGNDSNSSCSGTTNLTASTGKFSDGSGKTNYDNNANCKWVISPAGATQVSINFTAFDTEATYDKVYVYDGADDNAPLLGTFSGNTLPPKVTTSAGIGAMCVKFTSDDSTTFGGWSANYNATIVTPTCGGVTLLTTPTGTFTDGSGTANYTNNQQCFWYIAPPCATSVTLSLSQLNTELNYDGIAVYDSLEATNLIGLYSGTTLPASITSTTGSILVLFISDYANVLQGFTANYTSTGSSYCSGITTLNTSDYGTISDGSGANNYCNNSNCSWLIQPPQATSISLKFSELDLEPSNSADGLPLNDVVEIYDGTSASATLLGRYRGSNVPEEIITTTGGSMFIKFYSDTSVTKQGWSADYTSTQNSFCNSSTPSLTASSATFTDGSGVDKYANNSECSWLIQPIGASSVTLSFSAFDTELNYDGVIVYDGANNSAPVLGIFTGTTIPSPVKSTGGSMYVSFLSDEAEQSNGWDASYSSTSLGVNEFYFNNKLKIYPNPTNGIFTIQSFFDNAITGKIYDVLGKEVLKSLSITNGMNTIDIANLPKGIYLLKVSDLGETKTIKVIKE